MKKLLFACFCLVATPTFATPSVSVSDALAGEDVPVYFSGLLPDESLSVQVHRPDGSRLPFSDRADENGTLQMVLDGVHLRTAGGYQVQVDSDYWADGALYRSFAVKPGTVSAYRSEIMLKDESVLADGSTNASFQVVVRDAYGNVIPHVGVKVYSSRESDVILASDTSDREGIVHGRIKSDQAGVSTLSALVGDTLVYSRPELVFYLADEPLPFVGSNDGPSFGDFLKAQLFNEEFGELAYFSIEDIPQQVMVNEVVSARVVAKDENGEVVKNYLGRVRFSSSDSLARLPFDYPYDSEDQGAHAFSLAFTFKTPGEHTLAVHDLNNFRIIGEVPILVVDGEGGINLSGEGIQITSPQPGTYSLARITITGNAGEYGPLKLVDGPTILTTSLIPDKTTGDFIFQTPSLANGAHRFQAMTQDEEVKSDPLMIRIDRIPPSVLATELIPDKEMDPGENLQLKVSSNEPLSRVHCAYEGTEMELQNAGNFFLGEGNAPLDCGQYPVQCIVADESGNEFIEPNAAMVRVCETGFDTDEDGVLDKNEPGDEDEDGVGDMYESDIIDSTGNGISDQKDPENDWDGGGVSDIDEVIDGTDPMDPSDDQNLEVPPTTVMNLSGEGEMNRITLFWSPAKDDAGIWKYKILFGTDRTFLDEENETPDDRTQWYVDNLMPNTQYFFQVIAIDVDGFESPPSRILPVATLDDGSYRAADKLDRSGAGSRNMSLIVLALAVLAGIGVLAKRRQ